jgi:hypothetical protein
MKIKNDMSLTSARAHVEHTYAAQLEATPAELEAEGWVLDWAPAPCGGLQYLVGEPTFGGYVSVQLAPVALVSAAGHVTWLTN